MLFFIRSILFQTLEPECLSLQLESSFNLEIILRYRTILLINFLIFILIFCLLNSFKRTFDFESMGFLFLIRTFFN